MKLQSASSVFNMGDTSLRVQRLAAVNKVILSYLHRFSYNGLDWSDVSYQEEFYKTLLQHLYELEEQGEVLFNSLNRRYEAPKADSVGKRGRTWTNALVKMGLVQAKDRALSAVGINYLNDELSPADSLERLLGLSNDNLLYFRQLLKLRIYGAGPAEHCCYFYCFRFALWFLTQYEDVPKQHFLQIVESIKPEMTKEQLQALVRDYKAVKQGQISFDVYCQNHFLSSLSEGADIEFAKDMFATKDFSEENLRRCFFNRKSAQNSYGAFVKACVAVVDGCDVAAYEQLQQLSKTAAIKKAFGQGRVPFDFVRGQDVYGFLADNKDNPLLSPDHYQIYCHFVMSKHNDLIGEYADMCQRAFGLSGVISFDNGLVNLNHRWFFEALSQVMGESWCVVGQDDFHAYEGVATSVWLQDVTLCDILGLDEVGVATVLGHIESVLGVLQDGDVALYVEQQQERDFRFFVEQRFPRSVVVDILKCIDARDDAKVHDTVTQNATVPTIFEYMLTLAWYYISGKDEDFKLHKSFGVSLDGDRLPLMHRGGGAGDIEIVTSKYALLLEATLMNSNNQKRGELEPVIRHATNFKLQHVQKGVPVQTLFVANELDNNVMNIFRAMTFTHLVGTLDDKGVVDGLDIFGLDTKQLIEILQAQITADQLLSGIRACRPALPEVVLNGWREPIVKQIMLM